MIYTGFVIFWYGKKIICNAISKFSPNYQYAGIPQLIICLNATKSNFHFPLQWTPAGKFKIAQHILVV